MKVIDELIESARLAGSTQAKRGFGVYTQDDAIMERAFWEGVEARAKAIRDEVAALKAERDELLAALKAMYSEAIRIRCSIHQKWLQIMNTASAAIAKAEGRTE